RRRVSGGWQRRMLEGDLVSAYDWDAIYREVARELGGAPELAGDIDVATWVVEGCGQDGHIAALPGAEAALAGPEAQGERPVVVTPERAGAAKPQRRIFEAAGDLDLFVGDTLVHDVLGARGAGVASAWLHPRLPAELLPLTPAERAAHRAVDDVIARSLSASPHRRFHPEADVESCRPHYVLARVDEVVGIASALAAGA